jgi:hypothetical protein
VIVVLKSFYQAYFLKANDHLAVDRSAIEGLE